MTNCINCGAPLHGNKCAYCGTEYGSNGFVCNLAESDYTGKLTFDGKEYEVYLGKVEGHTIGFGAGRDITGRTIRGTGVMKRTFTLIEL